MPGIVIGDKLTGNGYIGLNRNVVVTAHLTAFITFAQNQKQSLIPGSIKGGTDSFLRSAIISYLPLTDSI